VNACQALDFLTSEHPKVMSAMSAILITVGAIPSLPAVSAGAGGALLASHAIQAAGAIAVGVGQALKAMSEGQVKVENAPEQASSSKH
jgi:flagellar biosynthesis component FlhA